MKRLIALLAIVVGCHSTTEPPYHCEAAKRALYPEVSNGPIPEGYLTSDVWRISPITTIYFGPDCTVTRVN